MLLNRKFNIASASREALRLPRHSIAVLADGRRLRLRRLSWAEALLLWEEFSAALLGLLAETGAAAGTEQSEPQRPDDAWLATAAPAQACSSASPLSPQPGPALAGALARLPGLALKLAALCSEQDAAELEQEAACDVLAIAATALRHNFIAPRGAADFFAALAELSG